MRSLRLLLALLSLAGAAPAIAGGCLITGDSLAVGAGQAMNRMFKPACSVSARVSAPSGEIVSKIPNEAYYTVVVSAGSNDARNPNLFRNLYSIRQRIRASRVIWILPYDRTAAGVVSAAATRFGDLVLDMAHFASRDRLHPANYAALATALNR